MVEPLVTSSIKKTEKKAVVKTKTAAPKKVSEEKVQKKLSTKKVKTIAKKKVAKKRAVTAKADKKKTVEKNNLKEKAEMTFLGVKINGDTKTTANSSVKLPSNISLRARAKAAAIADNLMSDFDRPAIKIAFVSGLSFVFLGAFVAMSNTASISQQLTAPSFLAQSTVSSGGLSTSISNLVYELPRITAFSVPATISSDQTVLLSVEATKSVRATRVSDREGQVNLSVEMNSTDQYKVLIPGSKLLPADYEIIVYLTGLDGRVEVHNGYKFKVPAPKAEITHFTNIESELSGDTAVTIKTIGVKNIKPFLRLDTDKTFAKSLNFSQPKAGEYSFTLPVTKLKPGKYTVVLEFFDSINNSSEKVLGTFKVAEQDPNSDDVTTITATNKTQPLIEEAEDHVDSVDMDLEGDILLTEETPNEPKSGELKIRSFTNEFTGPGVITVEASLDLREVHLYIRREMATTQNFLGSAIRGTKAWLYNLNTKNIPNGKYVVIAKAIHNGVEITSDPFTIKVAIPLVAQEVPKEQSKEAVAPVASENPDTDTETEKIILNPDPKTTTRDFFTIATQAEVEEEAGEEVSENDPVEARPEVQEETKKLLESYRKEIDAALKNYAISRQSGDTILIEAARQELVKLRDKITSAMLLDPKLQILADEINNTLSKRIVSLQHKVETFEELRTSSAQEDVALDTDSDGVSDFDERVLFKTDPLVADSDNDGVNDGVEIISGYNPLDASSEAVVTYESPKESAAYVENETLSVQTVNPIVRHDQALPDSAPPVQTEIRGHGIPNSFVTIYIFSTPTVVTVKTDSDGSFVYTFEKELEDGEHEVYVAVTDNTGEIVAQSNPFKFVKEAQAYTAKNDNAGAPIGSTIDSTISDNPYMSVVGLGVLGLGLVLLLIGVTLKAGKREEELVMTQPVA